MKLKNLIIIGIAFLIISCKNDVAEKKDAPDVSHISMNEHIIRFDHEVKKYFNSKDALQAYNDISKSHKAFADIYFRNVIGLIAPQDTLPDLNALNSFLSDPLVIKLQDTIDIVHKDLAFVEKDLNQMFKYYKHYFSDSIIPNVYTCLSGFGLQRFIFDDDGNKSGIGVGLEMYLGNDFPYKNIDPKNPIFSDYLVRSFNQDHIVRKVTDILVDDLIGNPNGVRLLDLMIHQGKKLYLIEKLMPFASDTIIHEFSKTQYKWCTDNEKEMWAFFLDEKLFYETSAAKVNKYVNPAPNSAGMPVDSPGRTACYLGWKIVHAYMTKFPKTTIDQLIKMNDAQKFLEDSKYKPSRK